MDDASACSRRRRRRLQADVGYKPPRVIHAPRHPCLMNVPLLQFGDGAADLVLRVHHDRAVPGDRLLDRLAGDQQEADAFVARLDRTSSPLSNSTSERLPIRSRTSSFVAVHVLLVSTPNGSRGAAKVARALEDIGEGVRRSRPAASCACRAEPRCRDSAARRRPLRPVRACPRNRRRSMRTLVPSSSVTSGIAGAGMSW